MKGRKNNPGKWGEEVLKGWLNFYKGHHWDGNFEIKPEGNEEAKMKIFEGRTCQIYATARTKVQNGSMEEDKVSQVAEWDTG